MNASPADVAILGAGAAGMFTALATHARGLRVVVVEPAPDTPNNFAISGGLFPAAGSRLQREAGVQDAPEDWLEDLRAYAAGEVNERIAPFVAHALPEVVEFLLGQGAPVRFLPDVVGPAHRALRFHSVTPASGAAFHAWFRQALRDRGIPLVGSASAPRTVLATGGFAGNPAMVAQHIPSMEGALHNGSATNDGSGIALGLARGGQLWGMSGYQGQAHTHPGGATRLGMSIPAMGGVMVNREGRRFVREDLGPSALAPHVLRQPGGVALEVFDAGIEGQLGNHSAYRDAVAAGRVLTGQSVRQLATQAGVDAAALEHTIATVNRCASGEATDPLGRERFARVLQAPFKASWVTGALSHTQGGLVTDADGRVLDAQDRPIEGLFACGGCAAGLAGRDAEGYLPGNGLAQAFGLGWRVAQALTR